MKLVRPQLKEPAQFSRRCSGPEAELLHQRRLFLINQGTKFAVKFREIGMLRDCVQRAMIAFVALVLPDVNYKSLLGLQVMRECIMSLTYQMCRILQLLSSSFPPS